MMKTDELRERIFQNIFGNDVATVSYREYDIEAIADLIDEGSYERATAQALLTIAQTLQNINAVLRRAP
jgi:endonuclease III